MVTPSDLALETQQYTCVRVMYFCYERRDVFWVQENAFVFVL